MLCEEILDVDTSSGPMAVLRKRSAEAVGLPKVVIFHDGPGIRTATHDYARLLAHRGYDVLVPDLYHRHGRLIGYEPDQRRADAKIVDRLWGMIWSMTDEEIQSDLDDALGAVGVADSERLGCVGFCLGARAVFRTMMRKPDQFLVGSMSHPSFLVDDENDSPHLSAHELSGRLFVGIGDADEIQSIEMQQAFFDAVAELDHVGVERFVAVGHGYTWPGHDNYDSSAADRCFAVTTALLAEVLDAR